MPDSRFKMHYQKHTHKRFQLLDELSFVTNPTTTTTTKIYQKGQVKERDIYKVTQ